MYMHIRLGYILVHDIDFQLPPLGADTGRSHIVSYDGTNEFPLWQNFAPKTFVDLASVQ